MSAKIKITTTRSEGTLMFAVKDALLPYGKSIPVSQPGVAKLHPVAEALMAVPGVDSAWIMGNEIQVTKKVDERWATVKSRVIEAIRKALPNS
ncbi:MAG: NifU N-terminal domain-containing protein [Nitrospinae bacterium]|nr:NifU N-terminal domain-containing protein [Nitrospinota bacterium]